MAVRPLATRAVSWPVVCGARAAALLASLLAPAPAPAAPPPPERALTLTVEDPCPALAAKGRSRTATVGGVTVSLEALYFASCGYLKERIVASVEERKETLQATFAEAARGAADEVYREFRAWVRPVAARELGIDVGAPGFDAAFGVWLADPGTQVSRLVDAFLAGRSPRVAALLERLEEDNSREIAAGLGTLWDDAKDRLERFTRASAEIERDPKTPYTVVLGYWGLSGPWLEKFQSYEHRFTVFDEKTRIVEASKVLYEALSADRHRDRIAGLFSLLETVGDAAGRSDVPGVSFFGQVVAAYGQVANELLRKVNALEDLLRRREGWCIGLATHTLEEKRSLAFRRQFGDGIQACPIDTRKTPESAIYQQTEPADADQLYFWLEAAGKFVKGRPRGGGMGAVVIARRLVSDGAALGFAELEGRADDLATLAAFYGVPYDDPAYGSGLKGSGARPSRRSTGSGGGSTSSRGRCPRGAERAG